MLLSLSFRWGSWCCQHARRAHRVGHLLSKSVTVCWLIRVNFEPVRSVSNRPDSLRVSRAPLNVWSYRLSFRDAIFVFSQAWGNTTVRRTSYRSSQAEWCLHSCTGSSVFHPEQACDLSHADGLRKSAVCAHLRPPRCRSCRFQRMSRLKDAAAHSAWYVTRSVL